LALPGVLGKRQRDAIRKAGYVVIETNDLEGVRVLHTPPLVHLDGLAGIALDVLADEKIHNFNVREEFKNRLARAAIKAHGQDANK
jgi:hypothetical protein